MIRLLLLLLPVMPAIHVYHYIAAPFCNGRNEEVDGRATRLVSNGQVTSIVGVLTPALALGLAVALVLQRMVEIC